MSSFSHEHHVIQLQGCVVHRILGHIYEWLAIKAVAILYIHEH